MAKGTFGLNLYREGKPKKTSQGRRKRMIGFSTMNKAKRRNWKAYRGQGK